MWRRDEMRRIIMSEEPGLAEVLFGCRATRTAFKMDDGTWWTMDCRPVEESGKGDAKETAHE